jgi:predicted DCC family thiol-disulfide oxidoreductase YuxK
VRFLLKRDARGDLFRYAPLSSDVARELVAKHATGRLPDSIVAVASDGTVRVRSGAALYLLARLGGLWALVAALGWLVPRLVRDVVYDLVAKVRKKLFAKPDDLCPVIPSELRERFL